VIKKKKLAQYGKIGSVLLSIAEEYEKKGSALAATLAAGMGGSVTEDGKIELLIEAADIASVNYILTQLQKFKQNYQVSRVYQNLINLSVSPEIIKEINAIRHVREVRLPERPYPTLINGEHTGLVSASNYLQNYYHGNRIRVGIIDGGFYKLTAAKAAGELPSDCVTVNYSASAFENFADGEHGTAVAEMIFETATNAALYLFKIDDSTGLGNAKNYCVANNIKIVNHSMGWFGSGTGRGDGSICEIADSAYANGIVWVNSAGNHAEKHYQAMFSPDGSSLHKFSGSANICQIGEVNTGTPISIHLTWDDSWGASGNDYDLYLCYFTNSSWVICTYSVNEQNGQSYPKESISINAPLKRFYAVFVKKYKGVNKNIRLLSVYQNLQYNTAAGSLLAPADAHNSFTIGAIAYNVWTGSPVIETFSSRGPTLDGRRGVALCGVDGVLGYAYNPGRFSGTSAAAPCVAGVMALVWGDLPSYTASAAMAHITGTAVQVGSVDSTYGYGKVKVLIPISGAPSVPVCGQGTFTSNDTITFTWNKNTILNSIFGYWIQASNSTLSEFITNCGWGIATNYQISSTTNEITYSFRIKATNFAFETAYSPWQSITIDRTPPVIQCVVAGTPGEHNVPLQFNALDSHSGVMSYIITNYSNNVCTVVYSTNTIITRLRANSFFTLGVKARDNCGNESGYSNVSFATLPDTTAPLMTSLTGNLPSGHYRAGSVFTMSLLFSEDVWLTNGTLSLVFNTSKTNTFSAFMDWTNMLVFSYTVQNGENISNFDINGCNLSGGAKIVDLETLEMTNLTPSATLFPGRQYIIDTRTPSIAIVSGPEGLVHYKPIVLTLQCDENYGYYRIGQKTYTPFMQSVEIAMNSTTVLSYYAEDAAGNKSTTAEFTYEIYPIAYSGTDVLTRQTLNSLVSAGVSSDVLQKINVLALRSDGAEVQKYIAGRISAQGRKEPAVTMLTLYGEDILIFSCQDTREKWQSIKRISIFTRNGKIIKVLDTFSHGVYVTAWDKKDSQDNPVPSGLYNLLIELDNGLYSSQAMVTGKQ